MRLVLPPVDRLRQRAVLHPTAGGSGWPMRHRPRHPRRLKHPLRISNSALWYRAMGGNVPAAQAVVRIVEARARVLGSPRHELRPVLPPQRCLLAADGGRVAQGPRRFRSTPVPAKAFSRSAPSFASDASCSSCLRKRRTSSMTRSSPVPRDSVQRPAQRRERRRRRQPGGATRRSVLVLLATLRA